MLTLLTPASVKADTTETPGKDASKPSTRLPLAEDVQGDFSGSVGLGSVVVPRFEGGSKYIAVPYAPLRLKYKGYQLQTRGLGLEADLAPSRIIDAGPIVQARLGRNGVGDSRVDALDEINAAMEVGGYVQINSPPVLKKQDSAYLRFSAVQDVVGAHRGSILEASTGYGLAVTPKLRVGVGVSTSFGSSDFMDSYFTVSPTGAQRSGLRPFQASSGIKDVGLSMNLNYKLTPQWGVAGVGGYSRLLGDAAESSITQQAGSPNRFFVGLFGTYSFGQTR